MSATLSGITNERLIGPLVAAVALGAIAVANFVSEGENGGAAAFAVSAVIVIAVAALLFGRLLPRARAGARPGRTALIMAVTAVVLLAVFWSGLPQVVAPAAIALGLAAPRSGESIAAVVLATVAYALSLVAVVVG